MVGIELHASSPSKWDYTVRRYARMHLQSGVAHHFLPPYASAAMLHRPISTDVLHETRGSSNAR